MIKELFRDAGGTKVTHKNRRRLLFVFFIIVLLFAALSIRLGWHMIIKGEDYAQRALNQQTNDSTVTAVRGEIIDSKGNALAVSATTNTIWVRTPTVRGNGETEAEIEKNAREEAAALAEILGSKEDDIYETITSKSTLIRVAKHVDDDTADKIRKADLPGIEVVDDVKRYYPMGSFASQIIGLTNDDGDGMTGLELYYNRRLSGLNGRWITSKDRNKNSLVYGTNKFYSAQDGYTIVSTIDIGIQYIVEEICQEWVVKSQSDRVTIIVMDPQTADVLAIAQSDEYDPNNPRAPRAGDEEKFEKMSSAEKVAYWNKMLNFQAADHGNSAGRRRHNHQGQLLLRRLPEGGGQGHKVLEHRRTRDAVSCSGCRQLLQHGNGGHSPEDGQEHLLQRHRGVRAQ